MTRPLAPAGPPLAAAGPSLAAAGPSLAAAGPSLAAAGPSLAAAGPPLAAAGHPAALRAAEGLTQLGGGLHHGLGVQAPRLAGQALDRAGHRHRRHDPVARTPYRS